ncbi:hypothetical protein [Pseudomonas putida]|uniref:hypothetical protein n=1 Tax=Pseudomonas putida TaxID=303 RepID=UPI00064CAAF8|nr:hypothetical protein [Pseudomonas putida]
MNNPRLFELEWYRQHGKYPERIRRDSPGGDYVIGDEAWHRKFPEKREPIEALMLKARKAGETPGKA